MDKNNNIPKREVYIPSIIINVFIILISLYLSILLIKSKTFHTYPCYNMIAFSLLVSLASLFRNIPINKNESCSTFEIIEAFFIICFDKLIICILTMQSLIYYLGVVKTKFYYDYEKSIYFITLSISIFVSLTLTIIYVSFFELKSSGTYCYCKDDLKNIIDSIFLAIFFIINIFCTINVMAYVFQKKKEAKAGLIEDLDYNHHAKRILILFFLNLLLFFISFLLNFDKNLTFKDLLYIITLFTIDLVNSLNRTVYKETLKIFCKQKYEQKYGSIKKIKTLEDDEKEGRNGVLNGDDDEDDEDIKRIRTESF